MFRVPEQQPKHKLRFTQSHIGKYHALVRDGQKKVAPIITLGPQYIFFFICFLFVNALSAFLLYKLNKSPQGKLYFYVYMVIVIYLDITWLACALINPGIASEQATVGYETCEECYISYNMTIPKIEGRYHCKRCEVCVDDFKYHCYISGNCVGKNNFVASYFLLLGILLWVIDLAATLPFVYYL